MVITRQFGSLLPPDATQTSVGCHRAFRRMPLELPSGATLELENFRRMPVRLERAGAASVGCHSRNWLKNGLAAVALPSDATRFRRMPVEKDVNKPSRMGRRRGTAWRGPGGERRSDGCHGTAGAAIVQQRAAWSAWRPRECGWRPGGVRAGHGAALTSGIRRKFGEKCLWVLPRSADDGAWADLARAA